MFDTTVTIVGNALNAPELRRTTGTNTLVASFRVASTSRRYDRDSGRWVDGPSLRVRVTCWRRLAEGVKRSVVTGDPLVVTGRMYTRDWIGDDGQHRVSYELEAIAVGHDLSRGFASFTRHRPAAATSVVEDAEAEARIGGQVSVPVPTPDRPRGDLGDLPVPDVATAPFEPSPMTDGYDAYDPAGTDTDGTDTDGDETAEEDAMNVLRAAGLGGSREPEDGEPEPDEAGPERHADPDPNPDPGPTGPRPGTRRGRTRVPVPA